MVSLGDPYQSQRRAHRLLELTESRLARIDRTKLTEQSAAAYDQASSFVDAAHEALDKRDYSAASSLAEKASLLTNKLISE